MLIMVFIYKEQASPALPRDLPPPPLPRRERPREKGNLGGCIRNQEGSQREDMSGDLGH